MPDLELVDQVAERIPDYTRLSRDEVERLRRLDAAGLSQVQIAQELQCSQPTVSRWLTVVRDPIANSTHKLTQAMPELTDRFIQKARPQDILEAMRDTGVTEKKAAAGQGKGGVTVVIGAVDSQVQVNIIGTEALE